MDGAQEKRQFNYPKRDELIDQIKELDDDIEHVSLNLIKCDFNATEKDVQKAFPDYQFIKVKNYNPGSFEVILQMKIDAINFIRNCYDRKILARRFFIKLGRQKKEVVEDWACVGYVPRKFNKDNNNRDNNKNNKKIFIKGQKEDDHDNKQDQEKSEHKKQIKEHQKDAVQKETKKWTEEKTSKPEKKIEKPKVIEEVKKVEKPKAVEESKKVQKPKVVEEVKKAQKPKANKKKEQKVVEKIQSAPKAQEDDEWIQVPVKPKGKKK